MRDTLKPTRNVVVAATLVAVVVGMVGLAYASVPLYTLICRVTGLGGTTQRAAGGADRTLEREVVVRFDGNVAGLPWNFRPEIPQITLKLGETALVNFVVENAGKAPTSGTATFNVQPDTAGLYFNKIECFCFTKQNLQPGERLVLPVEFFVSPDLAEDRELNGLRTITLSYTFFPTTDETAPERQPVARTGGDAAGENL